MIDSRTAAHKAVYAALNDARDVTSGAEVWGHPEEGTEPKPGNDLVLLGPASADNVAGKDGDLDEVTIDIFVEVRQPDITALYARSAKVRAAIEGQAIAATGADISKPEFVSANPELMEDGETFFDTLRFKMFVQPA